MTFEVTTSDGQMRSFKSFDDAEFWARNYVAASGRGKFAVTAMIINNDLHAAYVRLDSNNRVWTDMGGHP